MKAPRKQQMDSLRVPLEKKETLEIVLQLLSSAPPWQ